MANTLTPAQRNLVIETLDLDKACNYSRLEYYLKQIISGRDVTFETRSDQPFVVSSQEAWSIIVPWAQGEGSLPIGDRKDLFNMRSRATKLLDYLQTNVSGKTAEAAASYQLILDQANTKIAPVLPSQDPQDYNIQKIYSLRRLQTDILQAGIIGKIYTNLEKSKILAGVPAESRNYVLRMFAASSQSFRYNPAIPTENFTPEKIHQLLLHTPGVKDVNSIIRLFYSNAAKEDIQNIVETIEGSIREYGETKYQKEMEIQRNLTALSPSLDSVSYLVNSIDIHATSAEKIKLIRSLKSQIINSASSNHQSGDSLLKAALQSAGFPEASAAAYKSLLPYLEELEIKQRHLLLGADLSDHDSRLLATKNLAKEIGVSLDTPWYTQKELDKVTAKLTGGKSLQEVFDLEYAKGNGANLLILTELSDLMGKHQDYKIYHDALSGNLWYQSRDIWDKGMGRFQAVKQPIDRFTGKLWAGYNKIDDVIFSPIDNLSKWWEKQQDKRPWLNPFKLVSDKWTGYQSNIALKIHTWAIGVSASSWFGKSGFAGHIADFTEGFTKNHGDWGSAGSFFFKRKWGNTLDWATKTFTKHKDFTGLKVSIANTIWNGFSKIAPGLSAKMMAGSLAKVITTFLAGELTLGATIAIQVGWEAIKAGFSSIVKFVKDVLSGNSANLYGTIPLVLGSLFLAINTALGGIPALLVISYKLLKVALKMIWDLFLALLVLSALVTVGIVTFFTLVWYDLISPTFHLDSNLTEIVAPVICDQSSSSSSSTSSSSSAAAAMCIVETLQKCSLNPLTSSLLNGTAWKCALAALAKPQVAEAIYNSTLHNNYFQCVGFVAATAAWIGKPISQINACSYVNNAPSGFKYISGTGGISVGDFFVIGSSNCANDSPGHIGVVCGISGVIIKACDANYSVAGGVRSDGQFAKSQITGYLK